MPRAALGLAVAVAVLSAGPRTALACACCTHEGQRNVGIMPLEPNQREVIASLRFAEEAKLYLAEADPDSVAGIANPSARYALEAAWQGSGLLFTLTDEQGEAGTLELKLPGKIAIFEVDPRSAPGQASGPTLYKEWKLTGKVAGSGAFGAGGGPDQLLTLIVQGRGNSCTTAADFSHWTLVMQGPTANYSIFGTLVR